MQYPHETSGDHEGQISFFNFLVALAMKPPSAWRVANIIEPVTRHFLISRRFVFFADHSVEQGRKRKSKRSEWRKRISPKSVAPDLLNRDVAD